MLSHRRQSQPQSEAATSISGVPDPAAALHGLSGLKSTPGIDGIDSSAVFVDDEVSEKSFEPTKEHPEARMLTVQTFSHSCPNTSV